MKIILIILLIRLIISQQNQTYVKITGKNKTKTQKKSKSQIEEEEMNKLWDDKIHSFNAKYLITTEIETQSAIEFFYDLSVAPNNITIAYYVHDEESKISFELVDYNGHTIYRNNNKNKLYHEQVINQPATYTFKLNNIKVSSILSFRILKRIE